MQLQETIGALLYSSRGEVYASECSSAACGILITIDQSEGVYMPYHVSSLRHTWFEL
jgi:hypothetical protein